MCHTSPTTTAFLLFFPFLYHSVHKTVLGTQYTLKNKCIQNEFIIPEQMNDSPPGPKNKICSLVAFVWNWRGWCSTHPSILLIGWTYYTSVSKVIFRWISPCILKAKQFTFEKKISLPVSFLQNPLTTWVFLATEITSDYSVKCSSGENCMFRDACNVQLSNIRTVAILKESAQCREMGNTIKALGCIERRRPKESLLTYLIPGMGN